MSQADKTNSFTPHAIKMSKKYGHELEELQKQYSEHNNLLYLKFVTSLTK